MGRKRLKVKDNLASVEAQGRREGFGLALVEIALNMVEFLFKIQEPMS
jgi:hypothetical protein